METERGLCPAVVQSAIVLQICKLTMMLCSFFSLSLRFLSWSCELCLMRASMLVCGGDSSSVRQHNTHVSLL